MSTEEELAMKNGKWVVGAAIAGITLIDLALIFVLKVDGTAALICVAAISALGGHPIWEALKQVRGST